MTVPASVVAGFLAWADATPVQPCIHFAGRTLTYNDVRIAAIRWAAAFAAWGIAPGERVALFLDNCPDFLAAYFGVSLAGGVVVLVNTQYRQVELRHILADSGTCLCITDAAHHAVLDRVRADLPDLTGVVVAEEANAFLAAGDPAFTPHLPAGDDLAVLGYTSGTTGRAKGAMILHRNLAANSAAIREAWGWTASDHLLLTLPLFHTHGLMVGAHGTLTAGATMSLSRRFDAPAVFHALQNDPVTLFFGVPTMYVRLLQEAEHQPEFTRRLRLFVSGSAPLSTQIFEDWRRVFGQTILERYGMTETGMNTTNPYDHDHERRPGTVGMPFPGQEARVVDVRTRAVLPDDETGEIEVRGPHVCAGYWLRPDATAENFGADGWFRTGDLGFRDPDGYYMISGRAKELIISGGYNIYPREVEEVLAQCPGVAEVAVIGVPDAEFGESVAAIIVPSDPALTAAAVVAFCRDQLASYKKPKHVRFVAALPRNAMGKVQKHLLQEQIE